MELAKDWHKSDFSTSGTWRKLNLVLPQISDKTVVEQRFIEVKMNVNNKIVSRLPSQAGCCVSMKRSRNQAVKLWRIVGSALQNRQCEYPV